MTIVLILFFRNASCKNLNLSCIEELKCRKSMSAVVVLLCSNITLHYIMNFDILYLISCRLNFTSTTNHVSKFALFTDVADSNLCE